MRKRGARALIVGMTIAPSIVASCLDFSSLDGADASADASITSDVAEPIESATIDTGVADSGHDAGDARFCASNPGHSLCDDFDDQNFLTPWNAGQMLSPGALGAQAGNAFVSPPFSYQATLPAIDAATESWIVNKFPTLQNDLRIEFDAYLDSYGGSTTTIADLILPGNFSFTLKLMQPSPPTLELVEVTIPDGGSGFFHTIDGINFMMSVQAWHHIFIDIQLGGPTPGLIQMTFDRGVPVNATVPTAFAFGDGGNVTIQAGIASFSGAPFFASTLLLDNYIVDLK